MPIKLHQKMLNVTLSVDDARKVEVNAKSLGVSVGDVLADVLRPITEYPHGDVAFVTIAVIEEDYDWLRAYAKLKGYGPDDLVWLLDEAVGKGIAALRNATKAGDGRSKT